MDNKKIDEKTTLFKASISNLIKAIVIPISIIFIITNILITRYALTNKINTNDSLLDQLGQNTYRNLDMTSISVASIASNVKIHKLFHLYSKEKNEYEKNYIKEDINELIGASLNYATAYETVIITLKSGQKYVYGNEIFSDINIKDYTTNTKLINDKVNVINDYIQNNEVLLAIPIKNKATIVDNILVVVNKNFFSPKKEIYRNENVKEVLIRKTNSSEKINLIDIDNGSIFYNRVKDIKRFNLELIVKYELNSLIKLLVSLIYMFIIGAVIIIISIYFYYKVYSRDIINPITETAKGIRKIRKTEEFDEIFKDSNINEIYTLNNYLNLLVNKINFLLKENQRINDEKLEIEIATLQSQITPHFIFNTLNSIRIQAVINEDHEVAKSIKNFTSLISHNFGKGTIHTLNDEVISLESYFNIMKIRYGNKIKYSIEIEDEIKENKILKLILQPIIENSIIHGLSKRDYEGSIKVKIFKEEDKIIVNIFDNGSGIKEKEIEEILTGKSQGIGVYNSNRRIKIYYGDEYGIEMKSEVSEYTETTIKLPSIV